jgi:NAD(P)-dependent dehydrogenase (short-subunit alcohol dehydrogenase family)
VGSRPTVLITGCSSPQGIGFHTARTLARRGYDVHATVRDHTHDAELRDGLAQRLSIHDLDLRDAERVRSLLAEIPELDVLVNNAGYGLIGGVEQVDLDRVREHFETNVFCTVGVIQAALPGMRARRRGHVINVSTIFAAGLCLPALGYYVASKAALETISQALAIELAPWRVRVTNFQPGPVMTELEREWGARLPPGEDPRPGLSDELYAWVLGDESPTPQSPQEAADALCAIVEQPRDGLAAQSGTASEAYVAAALRDPTRASELAPLLEAFARRRAKVDAAGSG